MGVLHTPQHVSGGSNICPWLWEFVGRMQYAPIRTIQYLPRIGFNKCVFIRNLSGIDRGVLHTTRNVSGGSIICQWSLAFVQHMQYDSTQIIQSLSGIRFNKYVFMRYLSRIGRGVLHTPQHVSGGLIICPWLWVFASRMQYAPTRTTQSLSGIGFNKCIFIKNLSGMGGVVLHTPRNVSARSIICPRSWVFVEHMQYAPI